MDYLRVTSEPDLAEALSVDGAAPLAGGTDLLVKVRAGTARPGLLVDVSRVETLRGLSRLRDGLSIGAALPLADLLGDAAVRDAYPLLAAVVRSLGSTQIRSRATLGGNLANASPAADGALALLAYDARVTLASRAGSRVLPLREFLRGPGRTALARGEYIRSIALPAPGAAPSFFFHKVGRRRALTIAIASVAGLLSLENGVVVDVRIAAGSVAPTPLRLGQVEGALRGRRLDAALARAAGDLASREVAPITDVRASAEYRRDVTGQLVARFLSEALPASS